MDIKNIGVRIRKMRKELKLTMEQLAEKVEITTNYIGNIERGESIPSVDTLVRIANALSVSMDYLCQDILVNFDIKAHNYAIGQVIGKMQNMNENQQMEILAVFDSFEKAMSAKNG